MKEILDSAGEFESDKDGKQTPGDDSVTGHKTITMMNTPYQEISQILGRLSNIKKHMVQKGDQLEGMEN